MGRVRFQYRFRLVTMDECRHMLRRLPSARGVTLKINLNTLSAERVILSHGREVFGHKTDLRSKKVKYYNHIATFGEKKEGPFKNEIRTTLVLHPRRNIGCFSGTHVSLKTSPIWSVGIRRLEVERRIKYPMCTSSRYDGPGRWPQLS